MRYRDDDDFLYWNKKEHDAIDKYWEAASAPYTPRVKEEELIPKFDDEPPPIHKLTFYWQEGRFWDVDK